MLAEYAGIKMYCAHAGQGRVGYIIGSSRCVSARYGQVANTAWAGKASAQEHMSQCNSFREAAAQAGLLYSLKRPLILYSIQVHFWRCAAGTASVVSSAAVWLDEAWNGFWDQFPKFMKHEHAAFHLSH